MYDVMVLKGTSSLRSYLDAVYAIPNISVEQEKELLIKIKKENCQHSVQQIIFSHLKFVVHMAKKYSGSGLPLPDLIQEGNLALFHALKNFDIDNKTCRFVSFAVHHISAALKQYVSDNIKSFRLWTSKPIKKAINHIAKLSKHESDTRYLSHQEILDISQELSVPVDDVRDAELRYKCKEFSINQFDDEEDENPFYNMLHDERYEPTNVLQHIESSDYSDLLHKGLSVLNDRQRDIISSRYLTDTKETLVQLGKRLGVSTERVRQIEVEAITKMREAMV